MKVVFRVFKIIFLLVAGKGMKAGGMGHLQPFCKATGKYLKW
ncbi:MAG: hypothetical protein WC455_09445 [Dehalococcoidia bacterium]